MKIRNNKYLRTLRALAAGTSIAVTATISTVGLLTPTEVRAQSNTDGAISGKISTAVGTGGSVTITNKSTGVTWTATPEADGSFRAGSLPPGPYSLSYTNGAGATIVRETEVRVGSTTPVSFSTADSVEMERFVVTGNTINPVDFERTESVTVFTDKLLKEIPVAQNVSAVALLAPGTTQGDSAFGNLISFGGASVAENAYFINGFNVSNFRNGLDPSSIPFEFYDQFEVKTGAYSAEFGRSTGGVVNATTKSGTNEFHGGVSIYWTPARLRSTNPDVYYKDEDGSTQNYTYNSQDSRDTKTLNFWASGPIIKNMLFFYGIYTVRKDKVNNYATAGTEFWDQKDGDPFWGGKIDFFPFKGHHFEYTAFSDKSAIDTDVYPYDLATNKIDRSAPPSKLYSKAGGRNDIIRYTGKLTEDLTVSALYGKNHADKANGSTADFDPGVYDTRTGHADWLSGNPDLLVEAGYDEREALRFDVEYKFNLLGSHRLRAGYDTEDNLSYSKSQYTGGVYWRYYTTTPGAKVNGATIPEGVTQVVRERKITNEGSFGVKTTAMYLEDNWTLLNDRLLLRLGVRNESFENKNVAGDVFIKIDRQLAPRLGVSYDLFGDKKTKLFANYGRYHLPIASNTNIRLAGAENFTQEYYILNSINSNFTPVKGAKLGGTTVYSDGSIKDEAYIVDKNIKPMYQDEWMIGVQHELNKLWTVGTRFITRDLKTSIDDVIVDHALAAYAARKGITNWNEPGAHEYVLANPGSPISYLYDIDGDGDDDQVDLTVADLGFDKATRKYYAVELFFERMWDKKWNLQGSYTWSHSYGNTEGWVKSDNGQDDAGLTSAFDAIGLMANGAGDLPNDRRHQFKLFGSYAITKELSVGANTRLTSGRPRNKLGYYPYDLDPIAYGYGAEAFWTGGLGGKANPRGSAGRGAWTFTADLSLSYKPTWGKGHLNFGLDVFNVLNRHGVTEVVEQAELDEDYANPRFGLAKSWQAPRSVRLSVALEF